jgi:hypothetical protein
LVCPWLQFPKTAERGGVNQSIISFGEVYDQTKTILLVLAALVRILIQPGACGYTIYQLGWGAWRLILVQKRVCARPRILIGIQRIEIDHAGPNAFDGSNPHIWFVTARVYAERRRRSFAPPEWLRLSRFFLPAGMTADPPPGECFGADRLFHESLPPDGLVMPVSSNLAVVMRRMHPDRPRSGW